MTAIAEETKANCPHYDTASWETFLTSAMGDIATVKRLIEVANLRDIDAMMAIINIGKELERGAVHIQNKILSQPVLFPT